MIFVTTVACNDDGTATLGGSRRRLRVRQRRQEIGRGGVRRARHLRRLRVFGAGVALRLRRIARGVPLSRVRREGAEGVSRRGSTCWTASIWDTPRRWRSGSWRAWRPRARGGSDGARGGGGDSARGGGDRARGGGGGAARRGAAMGGLRRGLGRGRRGVPGGGGRGVSSRRRTRVSIRRRTSASTCTRTAGWKEMTKTTTRMRCETATRTPSRMRRTRRR